MFLHDMKKKRKEIADQKRCKALYDYQADNEDELSLTKGDILEITNTNIGEDGWWEGRIMEKNGKPGIFPQNFVKVLSQDAEPSGNEEPSLECLKCVALRDFCGKNPEELFINEGDIIQVTRKFDDGWWHGKVNGQHGMFPSTFVRPIQSEEKTLKPSDADLHYGKALIENFPRTEDELGFQAGAIIFITSKTLVKGWFEGKLGSKKGIFPTSCVELLTEEAAQVLLNPPPMTTPGNDSSLVTQSYEPLMDDELKLSKGNLVFITNPCVQKGWMEGVSGDKKGLFPSMCVDASVM
uniref:SH3 domain-containing protein n=1 Tax=Eptatretus burgeri TaxID=7764 RepID=A0A8C4Q6C0_EPTBU